MDNVTGERITYVIYQERPEVRDGVSVAVPLTYNAYNGSFNEMPDFRDATAFESEEEAIQLATLQNTISGILKQSFNYIVIKQVNTRTTVYSGKEVDEPEEPIDPEVPEEPNDEPEA